MQQQPISMLEELSKFIITSKYSRYKKELGRRETWEEGVDRVQHMHLNKFDDRLTDKQKEKVKWAFQMVKDKKVIPSMRSMQFGGKAIETKNERIYNCAVRHVDSLRAFAESFYLLLCGCGVGFGMSKYFVNRIPELISVSDIDGDQFLTESLTESGIVNYTIEDTIEGWADSLEFLLKAYTVGNEHSGKFVNFDYSLIREKGAELKTSGGKAPGPDGLRNSLDKIQALLITLVASDVKKLRPIHCYDILMHSADAVLSGGVRRSACSVIFDKDDEEMLNAKTGDWYTENPQRARSNNSVLLLRSNTSKEEFEAIIERTKQWGEPGFVWADHPWTLYNPCFEVSFIPVLCQGKVDYTRIKDLDILPELNDDILCGVQMCNLSSQNGVTIKNIEDWKLSVEAATIIGTLQAAYTDFPYLGWVSEHLTREEALLGVSMTGMMDNPDLLFNPVYQKEMAQYSVGVNTEWASILGINPAARATVIKPEGTGSLALGTLAAGIHGSHAHIMFRNVQCNKQDPPYQLFKQYNPHMCEESVWSANKTDDIITWPIEVPENAITKDSLNALQHLEMIRSTQENWIWGGVGDKNGKPVSHNVSCTVIVDTHEWSDVIDYVYNNKDFFAAISFLGKTGDKDFPQCPNIKVQTEEDWAKYKHLLDWYIPVDYTLMMETEDTTKHTAEAACAGGACEVIYTG